MPPKRPVAIPVVPGIVEMGVGGDFYGDAIAAHFVEAALASPVFAGGVEVGVLRNLDGHAGLIGLAETAFPLPAASEPGSINKWHNADKILLASQCEIVPTSLHDHDKRAILFKKDEYILRYLGAQRANSVIDNKQGDSDAAHSIVRR